MMSPDDDRRILELFGLSCKYCFNHARNVRCTHCDGTGYSLKEATRDNWPFWPTGHHPQADPADYVDLPLQPFMPDFHTDDARSIRLAEQFDEINLNYDKESKIWTCSITKWGRVKEMYPNMRHHAYGDAPKIGKAITLALEAADQTNKDRPS